jgi:hypothetical protein
VRPEIVGRREVRCRAHHLVADGNLICVELRQKLAQRRVRLPEGL